MKLPLWVMRWLHQRNLSRQKLRGSWLHNRLGDRIFAKDLWRFSRESVARAWLVGFPITMVPFLPFQTVFATIAGLFVRGNLLLCIALQFLSSPLTAPVQLPACYFVGELVRGRSPSTVWAHLHETPLAVFSGDSVISLYLGAVIIGALGGAIGYAAIRNFPVRSPRPPLGPSAQTPNAD